MTVTNPTPNLSLSRPTFNTSTWHDEINGNFTKIDAFITALGIPSVDGAWINATAYVVEDRVIDETDSTVWLCEVGHTSAGTGSFSADRAANPTYWTLVDTGFSMRGEWGTGLSYKAGDVVYDTSQKVVAWAIVSHTSTTGIRTDAANWEFVIDFKDDYDDIIAAQVSTAADAAASTTAASTASTAATAAVAAKNAAETAETNAETAQAAAATSATNAATSETNAAASESAAQTSETNAATSETNAAASAAAAAASAATLTTVPEQIVAAATKATPVDADSLGLVDSEAGNALKELTLAALKTFLETYFDTQYTALGVGGTEIGVIEDYAGHTVPAKWLLCFGQNVSRTTYASLFAALCKQSTVTITIASPGVVTWNSHGRKVGDPVSFTTTGALPTGIVAGTTYFVHAVPDANTFRLTGTFGGSVINTSGSQSGVHTALYAPFGRGDGSTTFGLPDARGRVTAGRDDMGGTSANRLTGLSGGLDGDFIGNVGGAETHVLTIAQLAAHTHTVPYTSSGATGSGGLILQGEVLGSTTSSSVGSGSAHNNVQPTLIVNKMIYAGV